jgi:hypothetical protein
MPYGVFPLERGHAHARAAITADPHKTPRATHRRGRSDFTSPVRALRGEGVLTENNGERLVDINNQRARYAMSKHERYIRLKLIWDDLRPFVEALRAVDERDLAEHLALVRDGIASELFDDDHADDRVPGDPIPAEWNGLLYDPVWNTGELADKGCARCHSPTEVLHAAQPDTGPYIRLCERCAIALNTH